MSRCAFTCFKESDGSSWLRWRVRGWQSTTVWGIKFYSSKTVYGSVSDWTNVTGDHKPFYAKRQPNPHPVLIKIESKFFETEADAIDWVEGFIHSEIILI